MLRSVMHAMEIPHSPPFSLCFDVIYAGKKRVTKIADRPKGKVAEGENEEWTLLR